MNKHTLFEIWAPAGSPWSAWAKAAPLSEVEDSDEPGWAVDPPQGFSNLPVLNFSCALVVDLPGPASIHFGVALAQRGYRPVVMINALPQRAKSLFYAVDVRSSVEAMLRFAPLMQKLKISDTAPPVFVLDASRRGRGRSVDVGIFDNRSVLFSSDFPSAARLRAGQIDQVVLVHEKDVPIEPDLSSVLKRWISGGIAVSLVTPDGQPLDVALPKTPRLVETWLRLWAFLFFHRSSTGQFGAIVPQSSGG